jgi:uncharacterized membrane protein YccC
MKTSSPTPDTRHPTLIFSTLAKMAFKMALASAISLVIAEWLQWEYPFYAVIAAIIVMSSTHGSTLELGIQRMIGTMEEVARKLQRMANLGCRG